MDYLKKLAPVLSDPQVPILIYCNINCEVISTFITEFIHKDSGDKR